MRATQRDILRERKKNNEEINEIVKQTMETKKGPS